MPQWLSEALDQGNYFMPHGHCYLWLPSLLWLHVVSDVLIGTAYVGISLVLYLLVRTVRLPFSPVFIAFGLFIALCGVTHFLEVWTVWNPDYLVEGLVKAATAAASVATAIGLLYIKPQVEEVVYAARLSEERRVRLESAHGELESLYRKVKEMDEMKTQFFSNVSHELRTPLTLILGPAERLLDDVNLSEEQRRLLESINNNGKSLLKQVNDLLDMAKMEAGQSQARYARLDLVPWLQRIASQFDVAAEQRRIRFRISTPEALLAEVDPDMLERVFINLMSNAFKFTPPGGEIRVALSAENEVFRFTVTDTGPGIETDQHTKIFERFQQADGGATRKHGGTGLGLAIARDFVDLHAGQIDVSSAPGQGATFTVHLPLTAPAGIPVASAPGSLGVTAQAALDGALQELSAASETGADGIPLPHVVGRPSILVIEDNAEMRRFIATTLNADYNVITASDGQEGLERAQALRPDLIVTDIMMPRMSGDQMIAAVRGHSELDSVPILLLTARAEDELRVKLLQNGAQDYLVKPFLARELQARATNLITLKRTGDTLRLELASLSGNLEGLAETLVQKHRQLRTALEATDVAREQAERASQVKDQFLAMVSHEMRTPLSTISMTLQLLERDKKAPLPASLKPRLARVTYAVQQMSALIEGLLQYTRLESGRINTHAEEIDTVALAYEVVETHKENVPDEVQLTLEPPMTALPPCVSDLRLLRVVMNNLVANALKFTKQGTVTIRLGHDDGSSVFEVHDTGIGIPEADLPRMFLPFEQLEPVQRKSIPGVGLGLTLVKSIVEALHGHLEVTSEVGAGSTFRVRLPVQGPATAAGKGSDAGGVLWS